MRENLKWWLLLPASLLCIYLLLPFDLRYHIPENMDRYQVRDSAYAFLAKNRYDLTGYRCVVTHESDFTILAYLEGQKGIDSTGILLDKNMIPGIGWRARFTRDLPTDQPQTSYDVWVSHTGGITGFLRSLPDTLTLPSTTEDTARSKAIVYVEKAFSVDMSGFKIRQSEQRRKTNRTDYLFVWEKPAGFAVGKISLHVLVQGEEIGQVHFSYELPENEQILISEIFTRATFLYLLQLIALTIVFIFALILFLKKYHEGEVSVTMGRNIFLIFFLIGLIKSLNELSTAGIGVHIGNLSPVNIQIVSFAYEVLLKNVFLGVFLLTSWSVGEAHARTLFPEKLNAIDSLLNRKFFTLRSGISLLRGGSIGFALAAFFMFLLWLLTGKGSDVHLMNSGFSDLFEYYMPVISVAISVVMIAMLSEIIFRFFVINIAYQKWHKKWIVLLISTLIWPFGYFVLSDFPIFNSIPLSIVLSLLTGLFLAWLYLKYDLLTVISANASAHVLLLSIPLLASSAEWHRISLFILIAALAIPLIQIIVSFIKKESFEFSGMTMPSHIRRISERERMQKELEIARSVQLGLLPTRNPEIAGFDIAGLCIPAREVGGDYFDYIDLGPNKLGLVIGDVSGKGVPAAIYMTLTKGIIQSHADDTVSPGTVLAKVNRLLYRNIEKNSFVSMFYAILDHRKHTLTFARAGHNPGIFLSQSSDKSTFLDTAGIALGLEHGDIFERTLKENTIQVNRGDMLVFYTDGFTEAMNISNDEFGEERLVNLISRFRRQSSEEIIRLLISEIKSFTGDAEQHDDMTIVVVKAL